MDSATEFLFGKCVNSLHAGLPYPHGVTPRSLNSSAEAEAANAFSKAFLDAQHAIATRERVGHVWPLFEIFEDKTKAPMKIVNSFIDPIVNDAIERHKRAKAMGEKLGNLTEADDEAESLLDSLVRQTSDKKLLKDETLNIMIAGRDTTSATLAFIVYFLSMYPKVTARLREEILDQVGPTRRPDYDDIREMKYLRAVINETLRLYPVVPFNVRDSVGPAIWPSPDPNEKPIYIPEGSRVPYSVFLMHRRTDLWGPDAQEFDPDRFIDERLQKYLVKNSFIFLPFNAGPRICLGQQFAYNEMSFMLIRLLQNFSSISLDQTAQPRDTLPPKAWANESGRKGIEKFWPKSHLTAYANGGMWMKMQEVEH
jgi:cytochrome P450